MKKWWKILFPILGIIAGLYVGYNLVLNYIEGNKMAIVQYNKAPKDHLDYGHAMGYKFSYIKYNKVYKYLAEGPVPYGFDDEKYLAEHPEDAVYIANLTGKDDEPWLLIFSNNIPRGYGLVYKKK